MAEFFMAAKEHNKKLAKKTKEILAELGHDICLGHAYELISRLDGFKNWDTASASKKALLKNSLSYKTALSSSLGTDDEKEDNERQVVNGNR